MLRPNILDCTLRDGGYYNNWFFSKLFVEKYINIMSLVNINYIELYYIILPLLQVKDGRYLVC